MVCYIRTKDSINFSLGERFVAVLKIIGEDDFVVIHIDRVYECINNFPLVRRIVYVPVLKLTEPVYNLLLRIDRMGNFRLDNTGL